MLSRHKIQYNPKFRVYLQGDSLFNRPIDAVAELVDNSIQACMEESIESCHISCHWLLLSADTDRQGGSFLVVLDNGKGMDLAEIQSFAILAETQEDKCQAHQAGNKMFIGKFGVGAKQAGFYLGDEMMIFSKPKEEHNALRFCMAANQNSFEGFVDVLAMNQTFLPENDPVGQPLNYGATFNELENLIKSHLRTVQSGTAFVIRLRNKIIEQFQHHSLEITSKNLKDIYHFHLKPSDIHSTFSIRTQQSHGALAGKEVQMTVHWHQYPNKSFIETNQVISLNDNVMGFLDQCKKIERDNDNNIVSTWREPFEAEMTVEYTNRKSFKMLMCFWYIPFENDKEQRPKLSYNNGQHLQGDEMDIHFSNQCILRCYWQNRLLPESVLKHLPFMNEIDTAWKNSEAGISPRWRNRIVGALFFDWQFKDISHNKLKLLIDPENELRRRDVRVLNTLRVEKFKEWLKRQCSNDKEITFSDLQSPLSEYPNGSVFHQLKYNGNRQYKAGDKVKIPIYDANMEFKHFVEAQIIGFVSDKILHQDAVVYHGAGKILYQCLPVKLYGSRSSKGEAPTKILFGTTPLTNLTAQETNALNENCPSSVGIYVLPTSTDVEAIPLSNGKITLNTGDPPKKLGVQILDSKHRPTWYPPKLDDKQDNRYAIMWNITDSSNQRVGQILIDNNMFIFDNRRINVHVDILNQKATNRRFYVYDLNAAIFRGQYGTYKLHISVLNCDRETIMTSTIEIELVPQVVKSVEILNICGLNMQLGEVLPSLQFQIHDKAGRIMQVQEKLTAKLSSEKLKIELVNTNEVGSTVLVSSNESVYETQPNVWKLVPGNSSSYSSTRSAANKEFEFILTLYTGSRSNLQVLVTGKFKIIVHPGKPFKIVSPAQMIAFRVDDQPKSLKLMVTDKWDHPVGPNSSTKEKWVVRFTNGPLMLANPTEEVVVDANGEIICTNNLAISSDYEIDSSTAEEQGIILKSALGGDLIDEQFFEITLMPTRIPKKLKIYRGGSPVESTIYCSPGETVNNLTYEILDENDEVMDILDTTATVILDHKRLKGQSMGNYIDDIILPTSAGVYPATITVTKNEHTFREEIDFEITAGKPDRWALDLKSTSIKELQLSADRVYKDLCDMILEVYLIDVYGNRITATSPQSTTLQIKRNVGSSSSNRTDYPVFTPILEIRESNLDGDIMDVEFEDLEECGDDSRLVAAVPLVQERKQQESSSNGKRSRVESNDSADLKFTLPSEVSLDIMAIFNNYQQVGQQLMIRIKSHGFDVNPSEIIPCTIKAGAASRLFVSTLTYYIRDPVQDGTISVPLRGQLQDLKFTVLDSLGNVVDLKGYSNAKLDMTCGTRNILMHSISDLKSLSKEVKIPSDRLQEAIEYALSQNFDSPMFTIRFELTLSSKVSHTTTVKLAAAFLHCRVALKNNVCGLQLIAFNKTAHTGSASASSLNTSQFLQCEEVMTFPVGSPLPYIGVNLITEDGELFSMNGGGLSDFFHIEIYKIVPSGKTVKESKLNSKDCFNDNVTMFANGLFEVEPKAINLPTDINEHYRVKVTFIDYRSGYERLNPTANLTIKLSPGRPEKLVLNENSKKAMKKVLCITSESHCEIGKNIQLSVVDAFDNDVDLPKDGYRLICSVDSVEESRGFDDIPKLQNSDDNGMLLADKSTINQSTCVRTFKSISLAGVAKNQHAKDGKYCLCFALYDEMNNLLARNDECQFEFTSNGTMTAKLQAIHDKMSPFATVIKEHKSLQSQINRLNQQRVKECRALKKFGNCNNNPDHDQVINERQQVHDQLQNLIEIKGNIEPAKKPIEDIQRKLDTLRGKTRQNILEQVVDAVLIKDRAYINCLGIACTDIIDAIIIKDSQDAQIYRNAELKPIGQDMIGQFTENSCASKLKCIKQLDARNSKKEVDPPGNPQYLWNLLQFDHKAQSVVQELFSKVLRDAIVFDTYDHAIHYRKYLLAKGLPVPEMFSKDGRKLSYDGIIEEVRNASPSEPSYAFGEYFQHDEKIQNLEAELQSLDDIINIDANIATETQQKNALPLSLEEAETQYENLNKEATELRKSFGLK